MPVKTMLRLRTWILTLALGLVLAATSPASEMGHIAADQVSLDSYYDFMANWLFTRTGHNRGPQGPEHDPCRDNIAYLFESYGLDVEFDTFTYWGNQYANVVATKLGILYPDQQFIIGAHYDSVNNPGADDNASGVALVLEAARIISQYESEYTIRFIAFDMEEQGLIGSQHYVNQHFGDDILGMISADMVAYDPNTNRARIYGRTASNPIKNSLAAAIAEYGDGLTYTIGGDTPYSDHAPFEAAGFQACLLIEGEVWNNPYYHTQLDCFDTPNYLNFPYAIQMTRSVVGWLVDQAGVLVEYSGLKFTYPDGRPEYVSPAGGTSMRVVVTGLGDGVPQPGTGVLHYGTGGDFTQIPMNEIEPNVYDAVFPAFKCGDTVYYYLSAQITEGDVVYNPSGAPSETYYAPVATGIIIVFEDNFDTDKGWHVYAGADIGNWERAEPEQVTSGGVITQPGKYDIPSPTYCYVTGPLAGGSAGAYDVDGGPTILTSPALDMPTGGTISYWRWYHISTVWDDEFVIQVSNDDGATWVTVEVIDDRETWTYVEWQVEDYVTPSSQVRVRFIADDTPNNSLVEALIDDFMAVTLECIDADYPLGDLNCDYVVDGFDIHPFVLALTDPDAYASQYPNCNYMLADINGDGVVDGFDIQPFVDLLVGA